MKVFLAFISSVIETSLERLSRFSGITGRTINKSACDQDAKLSDVLLISKQG
jgi:hypothetical protein